MHRFAHALEHAFERGYSYRPDRVTRHTGDPNRRRQIFRGRNTIAAGYARRRDGRVARVTGGTRRTTAMSSNIITNVCGAIDEGAHFVKYRSAFRVCARASVFDDNTLRADTVDAAHRIPTEHTYRGIEEQK